MGNIFTSSIGKKLIMSISGLFLILFLLVHLLANSAYLFGPEAFDLIIEIMGSPVVVAMVPILAFGFIIHIFYASYLTLTTNMKARGKERYAVPNKGETDSWSSKNMFVLGVIVLGFLVFHLTHFWARMQLPEFTGGEAENVNDLMPLIFGNIYILAYIIWFCALWFHLTHGFWSALQTVGMNNQKWLSRWKAVSYVYATVVVLGFIGIAVIAYMKANGIVG